MNKLYYGDCLDVLKEHIEEKSIDLVYIDPPFNKNRNFNVIYPGAMAQAEAFKDTWSLKGWQEESEMIFETDKQRYSSLHTIISNFRHLLKDKNPKLFGYLVNMSIRLVEIHRVLKDTGSLYLHCDPTASHYLKILLDEIFGESNFKNEIVWHYRRWSAKAYRYQRMHDIILFYTKSSKYYFDVIPIPATRIHQKKFIKGWDQNVVTIDGKKQPQLIVYNKRKVEDAIKDGRILIEKFARVVYKKETSVSCPDVFIDIPPINSQAKERLGYETQKPLLLLERIIQASCPDDGVVLDAFCGCGTSVVAAKKMKRQFVGIDITYQAIDLVMKRLIDVFYKDLKTLLLDVTVFGIPKDLEGARALATMTKGDRVRKEFEKWAVFKVGGVYNEKKGADKGLDGYFLLFDIDNHGKQITFRCPISIKSGKVSVKDIRDFSHVIDREESPLGIFVSLEPVTKPMIDEVDQMKGPRLKFSNQTLKKIYIVSVQDIFDEKMPRLPTKRATQRAERHIENIDNGIDIDFK